MKPFLRSPHASASQTAGLVRMFPARQRLLYGAGIIGWLVLLVVFWAWWLEPAHVDDPVRFAAVSLVLAWITLLPLYFLGFFFFARMPDPALPPPPGRAAMVVTKAPSEPASVVMATLRAMLAQDYPHDTWLADEDPAPDMLAWCAANGVKVSTRKGRADYHRTEWPRRTRCKEGNLAFFYDHFGYEHYDFVVQLDADHVPEPGYLRAMLAPFTDAAVGYVSAPSICDRNAGESWSARGRLYVEGMLHGALQAGYNSGWAPLCIGSHYAVRTAALREIGGLGPELAEDHSTSLMMNAHGWRGVHAINAIARGEGPQTFADLVTQEFQWSRSLVSILLRYSPQYVPMLPWRLRLQFLFSQLWYPLFSLFMLCIFAMPIVALITGRCFANVTFPEFVIYYAPLSLTLIGLVWLFRAGGWARPVNAKVLSWEGTLFLFARWPWALFGTLAAMRDYCTRSFVDFRITPKGTGPKSPLPLRVIAPYLVLAAVSAAPVLACDNVANAIGFYIFASVNAALYTTLPAVILIRHMIENRIDWVRYFRPLAYQAAAICVVLALTVASFGLRGVQGVHGLEQGAGPLRLTYVKYSVSGAGQDTSGKRYLGLSLIRSFFEDD